MPHRSKSVVQSIFCFLWNIKFILQRTFFVCINYEVSSLFYLGKFNLPTFGLFNGVVVCFLTKLYLYKFNFILQPHVEIHKSVFNGRMYKKHKFLYYMMKVSKEYVKNNVHKFQYNPRKGNRLSIMISKLWQVSKSISTRFFIVYLLFVWRLCCCTASFNVHSRN